MRTHVILFDRQDITRTGLEALLRIPFISGRELRISTVGTKSELVRSLVECPETVVVIDYTLSDLGSADSLLNIGFRFPQARWVLFSEELSVLFLKKVLCESGFSAILKTSDLSEIREAFVAALDGRTYVCPSIKELLALSEAGKTGGRDRLTVTEKEILREIALGRSAKQIAALRHVSEQTVTTHRKNIYRKLEVNNAQEAAGYALRTGIVEASDYFI